VAGDALVVLDVVATEQEAEVICGLLRSAGIACLTRQTNVGAGASDGLTVAGPTRSSSALRISRRLARSLEARRVEASRNGYLRGVA
jgi:hypothetical protein